MIPYRLLIVDNEWRERETTYTKLFPEDDGRFKLHIAKRQTEFEEFQLDGVDAVVLDVNLKGPGWTLSLAAALDKIRNEAPDKPVFLASGYWSEKVTHENVTDALSQGIDINFLQTIFLPRVWGEDDKSYMDSVRTNTEVALDRYYRRASLRLDSTSVVNILHLSDPQCGDPAEDKLGLFINHGIATTLLRDGLSPHIVVVTGDITYSAQQQEFETAVKRLTELEEHLWPKAKNRSRILLVPGNHDVDLNFMAAASFRYDFKHNKYEPAVPGTEERQRALDLGLLPFADFAYRFSGYREWKDLSSLCWRNESFRHLGIRFFHLNSTAGITPDTPKVADLSAHAVKRIYLSPWQIQAERGVFNIALSHHGPAISDHPEIESVKNIDLLKELIASNRIGLLMHGHGHARLAHQLGDMESIKRCVRVMAPTSHLRGSKRPDGERRGFNLIQLKRTDGCVRKIEFRTYEWDNGFKEDVRRKTEFDAWCD